MEITRLRFLVVEDQGFQRWLTGNLLLGLGAKSVLSADDGVAALEILRGADPPIDVVVSDLDMPGMDGMELIRKMAGLKYPASLLVVSSMEDRLIATVGTMAQSYGVSLLAALQKPLTAKKLLAALESYRIARPQAQPGEHENGVTVAEIQQGLHQREFMVFFQP
jgi:CheY-like chemotaxis protein